VSVGNEWEEDVKLRWKGELELEVQDLFLAEGDYGF
jgi:hypothetical protein